MVGPVLQGKLKELLIFSTSIFSVITSDNQKIIFGML